MSKHKYLRKRSPLLFPGWLFVAGMGVYLELLLHFWTKDAFLTGRFVAVVLFAMAFGALMGFFSSLLPKKAERWGTAILAVLITVAYMVEYFLHDAFFTFMSPASIFSTGGDVMTDFTTVIINLILRDFWRIALVLLPTVLYLVFTRPQRRRTKKTPVLLILVCGILYLAGFGVIQLVGTDTSKLRSTYDFDTAVHAFGLNVSLGLEAVNRGSADQSEDLFVPVTPSGTEQSTSSDTDPEDPSTDESEESSSTEETTEPVVIRTENSLDIDFAALAQSESNSTIASIHSYVASLTPSATNEYTGLFEGKNLILITAEAFSAEVIDPELTPTLYRLATQGIQFTEYYQPAWGGSTSTGEFSILTGLVPANGTNSIKEGTQQDMFLTIGKQLQKQNYTSYAFHNHSYTYYGRNQTHTSMGYDQFIAYGSGMEAGVTKQWPESDLEMMEYTIDMYIDQQPFSIYYMTVSGHCNYSKAANAMSKKNFDATSMLDASHTIRCYMAAQLELEYAMEYLLERLEQAGILDDTVIVLASDHYPYGLEKSSTWGNTQDYLAELYGYAYKNAVERDHSALIIWSGCLEGEGIVVDTPTYSLDILPTLSNLFGVEYDSRLLVGRDVFSDEIPMVVWNDYSWKTEKGFYNALNNKFTAAEGVEVDSEYVKNISDIVKNKVNFSKLVQNYDYYNYLTPYLSD